MQACKMCRLVPISCASCAMHSTFKTNSAKCKMCRQAGAHLVETGGADQRSPGAGGGAGPTLEQCSAKCKVHCA